MVEKRRLNVDIASKVIELQAAMKQYLPKQKLYNVLLRGKGLEFESYREYAPDDDANLIDWKATKRANKTLVREYRDERNLKIVFAIDVGKNMVLGSGEKLKCEYAAEVVASLARLIIKTGDRIGFLLFNDSVRLYVNPSGGEKSYAIMVDKITEAEQYNKAGDLGNALDFIYRYVNDADSVVVVSDFISFNEKDSMTLSLISKKLETLLLVVKDPLDYTLPDESAEIVLEDPKTGEQLLVNPKVAKQAYENFAKEKDNFLREVCRKNEIDMLEFNTTKPFVPSLSEFLKKRYERG